jgi:hypothetical protein
MKPTDLVREAFFPLSNLPLAMAIVFFGLLIWLADAAGLFGLWLAFIIVPAIFRYAIYVLEARAHGNEGFVPGVEIFNIADNAWGLFPLGLLVVIVWIGLGVASSYGTGPAQVLLFAFFLFYPASMAVLGVTRSPLASVNPVALVRMIRTCGIDYAWIPIVLISMSLLFILPKQVLPGFFMYFADLYIFFLLFTITGAVVHTGDVPSYVDIDAPIVPTGPGLKDELSAERQQIADHAYGFISRGNREGGFRHIRQWIRTDPDPDDAVQWFFDEMLRWENKDAALFFGQECLAHFLHHDQDARALKLMSRCIHEDPAWRPKAEDRPHAIELARRHSRDDLLPSLLG